jgi:tetratricopeptide (TPR) repeat protein
MDAQTCNDLAWSCLRAGQADLALQHALRAHELRRQNADYLNTLGVAYGETGQLELAEATFRKALKRKPGFIDALVNLGKALEKQEKPREACAQFERALAIEPRFPKLAVNLAKLYRDGGEPARAKALLERAERNVDAQDLAMALAECEMDLGDEAAALARLRAAVAAQPDWKFARNALAHMLLATAHWREGWREYAWRRTLFDPAAGAPPAPLPARLAGEPILLRGEQGIGDVLFFLRFAPELARRGARLTLACESKLHPVVRANPVLEAVREHRADDAAAGDFARRIWIADLPALLGTEDTPPAWPLALDARGREAGTRRLAGFGPAPYLAVTWRAGTDVARGREFGAERTSLAKALPPALLGAALRGWRGSVLLLQRGARPGDTAEFAAGFGGAFHDLSALGEDLPALLGVLASIDEYVTVSNFNVHALAGIGGTARVLVPCPAEWRWLRRAGPSPWFAGFPLYRQPASRDWSEPLARLRAELFR